MKIFAQGIDLEKTVFHLVALDESGQVLARKRCSRTQLEAFTSNLQVQVIGMEACNVPNALKAPFLIELHRPAA